MGDIPEDKTLLKYKIICYSWSANKGNFTIKIKKKKTFIGAVL
jgi:hypothetical protein